jgi:hypothetical protein
MKIPLAASSLILLAAFSCVASAQSPPSGSDMRCLLVGMRYSTATDAQQKSAGLMLVTYFYARLEQTPTKDLEDALAKEALDMAPTDFRFEANRCGSLLKEKAQAIKDIGADLMRRRQETIDAPNPKPTEK